MPGVTILIKGTNQGTLTDVDGRYSIKTFTGSVLVFSYMGITTEEKEVKGQTKLNITLKEDPPNHWTKWFLLLKNHLLRPIKEN
ncbi:putative outer membrane protein [Algibacter lectus]|uniref:Putative outer membrane protein n=1 Tax=Algibacter lectus TaxID=221126 RepID=A0A090X2A9_9FLAO|nr:putative outer membrane protein [Algibacter lectus]